MPKRTDIHTILIIGSGPIVIGQGCEFDYSGVQACRAIREEGYRVVLINSNPATIMTDPEFADATYIEPITVEAVEKILELEKSRGTPIDALLPTLGGQTGLNTGMNCFDKGILQKYGVKMIGANRDAIFRGEDRQAFKDLMIAIGLKVPASGTAHNLEDARKILEQIGLPAIIRPAFTLGGTGGGIAYNVEEFETIIQRGLDASPVSEVLIEQSVLGWKEFEMEVMRDKNDNVVIICSIENLDPMGIHTGDSITVAPIQTLTDKEYQRMRDASIAVIRAVGVETGGSNIQFAIDPDNGDMVVVEMNPRVSRSSALASKATGYPIAKLAAKLAIGYTLDELANDITSVRIVPPVPSPAESGSAKKTASEGTGGTSSKYERYTSACFEPTIDYCVVKIPRWTFEKFPDADETLTTQMKSVGEAMAIGRTFKEALQKGIRSMEVKRFGLGFDRFDKWLNSMRGGPKGAAQETVHKNPVEKDYPIPEDKLRRKLAVPSQGRLYYIRYALKMGWSIAAIHDLTNIDPWFLAQIKQLVDFEDELLEVAPLARAREPHPRLIEVFRQAKQWGYCNVQLGTAWQMLHKEVRQLRIKLGINPVYKLVDTCAAEFEAATPYYYSTFETPISINGKQSVEDEIRLTDKPKVIIIGGGPNRIGQGIEFDYCCVHAAFAMDEMGLESVMINSNPETVSTDYDTSDLLFFEPLTLGDVLNICERLNGGPFVGCDLSHHPVSPQPGERCDKSHPTGLVKGVIVQFGGQTPLNLARGLKDAGVPILGTTVDSIDAAGDREQFRDLVQRLGLRQPENGIARSLAEAREIAQRIGYPVLVRPSFVLGGRAMEIVSDESQLNYYMAHAVEASTIADAPILVDKFLDNATEVDVDCIADYDPHVGSASADAVGRDGTKTTQHSALSTQDLGTAPASAKADPTALTTGNSPQAIVIGVMEHIEEAGIHSGDSACALPPYSLSKELVAELKRQTKSLAAALRVRGLMNVQYAIKNGEIYLIEVNPRASRTVPFVSKATGVPWAKIAAKVMAGKSLAELGAKELPDPDHVSVKEVVFPFSKFPGVDVILGPEMRSTGEVMGIDHDFPIAYAKSQMAAGNTLPTSGTIFISVRKDDQPAVVPIARILHELGFELFASDGTRAELARNGIPAVLVKKLAEGRPNIQDHIKNGRIKLIINTPTKKGPQTDEGKIRALAVLHRVPTITTLTGAMASAMAIRAIKAESWNVKPLQDYFPEMK